MRNVGFIYDDVFLGHKMPNGHPECAERLQSITEALKSSGVWDDLIHIKPKAARPEDLLTVHTQSHIDNMKGLVGYADPDTYVSEGTYEAALYAAGAGMEAIDRIKAGELERAFCAVRPPGHHAEADRAMGFCIFNNIAVAARHAQSAGYKRVFIIDFDVHHGNGTQNIFLGDPDVYYFSSHQYPHYPGSGASSETGESGGAGATENHPMRSGAGLVEYSQVYQDLLPQKMREFGPEIVLVSAGYDLHANDPLSGIMITDEGIDLITSSILNATDAPAIFTLEGGYDLKALGGSVMITVKNLLE